MNKKLKNHDLTLKKEVFFTEDKTTCILSTKKVEKIIGSTKTLFEGSRVQISYEKNLYEALVLKLHGKFYIILT